MLKQFGQTVLHVTQKNQGHRLWYVSDDRSGIITLHKNLNCDPSSEPTPVLQIRRTNRDDLGIIFHISHKTVLCDPSLEEQSHLDSSNEGSQYMFLLRNK